MREQPASVLLTAGFNPGLAPKTSPLRLGQGRPDDLTGMAAGRDGGDAPAPRQNRHTTNGEFAALDPSGFRMIRQGTHTYAIPPDPAGRR
jgi:hypothetical protein